MKKTLIEDVGGKRHETKKTQTFLSMNVFERQKNTVSNEKKIL